MAFVPQITCRNCGTKYSALRGRCPSCGTRHVKQTGRPVPPAASPAGSAGGQPAAASGGANGGWQLIFGAVLIVAVIVAVIILISASLNPPETEPVSTPPPPLEVTTPPPTTPPPTPSPTPTVGVTSIAITYAGSPVGAEFTQRISWGSIQLGADVYPTEALGYSSVTWRSSDEGVCTVDDTGLVTPIASGRCEIIAECGGFAARTVVLVP